MQLKTLIQFISSTDVFTVFNNIKINLIFTKTLKLNAKNHIHKFLTITVYFCSLIMYFVVKPKKITIISRKHI